MGPGGHERRPAGGHPAVLARGEPQPAVRQLRPAAAVAHERGDLRLRGQRHVHGHLLFAPAALQGAHVQRCAELDQLLGLERHHRRRRHHAPARPDHQQGVRGAGMAHRHRHRAHLGGIHGEPARHHHPAPREASLRRHLVLHRHGAHGRGAPHRQLVGDSRRAVQELLGLRRRAGCAGAVVVRPQRRRVLPHHALPGPDVLLPAQGRQPPGVQLPALDHPFLGARSA